MYFTDRTWRPPYEAYSVILLATCSGQAFIIAP